jgi:hypothetical protein
MMAVSPTETPCRHQCCRHLPHQCPPKS